MTPFYLPVGAGQRFCVHFPAASASPRGTILHVHAFAEEMNKSRRAIAQAARSFAQAGWDVLLIDLAGCGDSSGELTDVTWNSWLDDLMAAARWMEHRGTRVSVIWGLRFGVLLAADLLGRIGGTPDLLLWQPVTSGRNHLTQFFRLKAASDMLGEAEQRTGVAQLRAALAAGTPVEVAGYEIAPALCADIESFDLPSTLPTGTRVLWLESGAASLSQTILPASLPWIKRWQDAGAMITAQSVAGPAFWQTVEIEEGPALSAASAAWLAAVKPVCA